MIRIICRCLTCGHNETFGEHDPIDECGPSCEKCMGPMVVDRVESTRAAERDARAIEKELR